MKIKQFKNAGVLFTGQLFIKGSSFLKQLLLAYFLGVSSRIDIFLISQVVPSLMSSMIAGGAGEILVTSQKKGKNYDEDFVVLFVISILFITILSMIVYYFSLNLFADLFKVKSSDMPVYYILSIFAILNELPSALVSTLQHLLFAKGKYNYYIKSSLLAEGLGLVSIVLLIHNFGIIAFAIGLLVASTSNAIFFFYAHRLNLTTILIKSKWVEQKVELLIILKKVMFLSGQTMMGQLSTFWERTLSMRFMKPGYLSALNYSKSLTDLPRMAMLSSVLTTTYIEQVNLKAESEDSYMQYSNKMEKLLSEISYYFQLFSILFGPLVVILFYKRGHFGNNAVEVTLMLYQVLTIGFVPNLMINFLSRTMYIEGQMKKLSLVALVRLFIEVGSMFLLVRSTQLAIPIALITGRFFACISLFVILCKVKPGIFNIGAFIRTYGMMIITSFVILYINQKVISFILDKSIFQVILYYTPFIGIYLLIVFFLVKRKYFEDLKMFKKKKKVKA